MRTHKKKLSGVFAPVVTPFRNDEIQFEDLRFNLRKLKETCLTGYFALGSNGEFKSLSDSEQIKVLEIFAEEKEHKIVLVGTARESTRHTIETSNIVARMGFDYVSIVTPSYFANRMDGPTLKDYYVRIADTVQIPVVLYNVPGFAGGVQIPPGTLVELCRHPNIAGIKDTSPTGPGKFLNVCDPKEDFSILAGSANFFYPSLHLGAAGGVLSITNALPEQCCELYRLFIEGRFSEARELHYRLARINEAVSGTAGVAGVKALMDITGYRGGEPRHPLRPLTDDAKEKIRKKLLDEGFSVD